MRSRWNLPIYLIYLAFSIAVIGYIVAQMGLKAPWSHQYSLTAQFSDAADILSNNEVYMDGVKVGHVGSVNVVNGQAQVQLVIDDSRALPLHANATAEVRKKNLLGETYIDLQRGSGDTSMAEGGVIPVDRTVPITEIDQVLAIFDPETVQRLQLLINALGDTTTNNGANMNNEALTTNELLTALNGPATELSMRQQQVQDIVLELQRFYTVLANQRDQVRQEFGTWNQVMAQLANQEGSIGGTVQQADRLLQNLNTLVSGETGNLSKTLSTLPTSLTNVNSFLDQANTVTAALAPYRQYIADIFPGLGTSFSDKDVHGNSFFSVFSLTCTAPPLTPSLCTGSVPSSTSQAPGNMWAAYTSGSGGQ